MNSVREINRINQRELELGVAGKGSWHDEYKESAYIYVGGLSFDLTEGDVITIFSQWGEIVDINMPRDKVTGKVRGFGFVMYENQRSTVMAVDNMNGAEVLGRTLKVDHCRKYNQPGKKNENGDYEAPEEPSYNAMPPILEGSESESSASEAADSLDDEDPMAAFIRAEKKQKAKGITDGKEKGKKRKQDGESKDERRARKEAKRAKRAAKQAKVMGTRLKVKEEADRDDSRSKRRREGSAEEERQRESGRANRDDWRDGRFELDRDKRSSRYDEERSDKRDDDRRRGREDDR